ncbi:MAG: type II CAAX endopeptidase family protein [Planctomycetota bacterium]|nr:type II CAAX endopeptidase family protein [Planctomycetota bacterium]
MQATEQAALPIEPSLAVALVGAVLVLASVALVPALRGLANRLIPARSVVFARWGFFHVGLAIFAFFALTIVGGLVLKLAGIELATSGIGTLLFGAGLQLSTVALVMSFAHRLDPDGIRSLGLRAKGTLESALLGAASYVAVVPAIVGAGLLSVWAWTTLGFESKPQEVLRLVLELQGAERLVFLLLAIVVIPFLEELFFRGFLQPLLVQNLGDRGGVAVTAVLFAAVHANLFAFLPLFAIALAMGLVMLRTQRIVGSYVVHALHNGLMIFLVLSTDFGRQLAG